MRWWAATVLVALAATAAGCDGGSPPERAASTFAPEAGVCHATASDDRSPEAYVPIACSAKHEAETIMVGRFGGANAAASAPPAADTEGLWQAYASCDTAAHDFLAGEWRESRLAMRVLTPSAARWTAGERWYRCDLVEMVALDRWTPNPRANSLRGALAGESPLRLGCYVRPELTEERVNIPPASCTGPHDTEFVGAWRAEPEAGDLTDEDIRAGCLTVVARYVGAPERELRGRLEALPVFSLEPEWEAGLPGAWCFLHTPGGSLDASLKGVGRGGLPPAR
ncbi:septum formation family protein [Micromonospora psammae]|uniref:septum formation family protein n=1 Tax=Micromonospora sp. CPCC 205556 TaxID=3122398 RepID=UPI002FF22378